MWYLSKTLIKSFFFQSSIFQFNTYPYSDSDRIYALNPYLMGLRGIYTLIEGRPENWIIV